MRCGNIFYGTRNRGETTHFLGFTQNVALFFPTENNLKICLKL